MERKQVGGGGWGVMGDIIYLFINYLVWYILQNCAQGLLLKRSPLFFIFVLVVGLTFIYFFSWLPLCQTY